MSNAPLLTIPDVLTRIGISRATLDRLIHSKQLRAIDVSSQVASGRPRGPRVRPEWRFTEDDVQAFLERRATVPAVSAEPEPIPVRRPVLLMKGADRYAR